MRKGLRRLGSEGCCRGVREFSPPNFPFSRSWALNAGEKEKWLPISCEYFPLLVEMKRGGTPGPGGKAPGRAVSWYGRRRVVPAPATLLGWGRGGFRRNYWGSCQALPRGILRRIGRGRGRCRAVVAHAVWDNGRLECWRGVGVLRGGGEPWFTSETNGTPPSSLPMTSCQGFS